jgi:hypothetical protein
MRNLLTIILTIQSFALFSQSVKITTDKGIDLKTYATFRVDKGELVTVSDQPVNETNFHKKIKEAITRELTQKGYQAVEDSTAQLVVSYVGEAVTKMDVENLGPLGQRPVSDPSGVDASRSWSREYREGSLVIDIQDPSRRKMVWQARGTMEITAINDDRAINAIIYKSFKKFPVRKK